MNWKRADEQLTYYHKISFYEPWQMFNILNWVYLLININRNYGSLAQFHSMASLLTGAILFTSPQGKGHPDSVDPRCYTGLSLRLMGQPPSFPLLLCKVILHVRLLSLKWDIYDKGATPRLSGLLYHLNAAKSQEERGGGLDWMDNSPLPVTLCLFPIMLIEFYMYCSLKLTEVEMGGSHGWSGCEAQVSLQEVQGQKWIGRLWGGSPSLAAYCFLAYCWAHSVWE